MNDITIRLEEDLDCSPDGQWRATTKGHLEFGSTPDEAMQNMMAELKRYGLGKTEEDS